MNLLEALIVQTPSLELQRAAHAEICRLQAAVRDLQTQNVMLAEDKRGVSAERAACADVARRFIFRHTQDTRLSQAVAEAIRAHQEEWK